MGATSSIATKAMVSSAGSASPLTAISASIAGGAGVSSNGR
ncbi:hypothetical protein [Micromonospora sp. DT62]